MENIFKIAMYEKFEDGFIKIGYAEFTINYMYSSKSPSKLKILVNKFPSNSYINLLDDRSNYKDAILKAVSEYNKKWESHPMRVTPKKILTLAQVRQVYSKNFVRKIEQRLLVINKEESRDKLTKFNLILNKDNIPCN